MYASILSSRQSCGALYLSLSLYDDFPYKRFILFQVQVVNISQSHTTYTYQRKERTKRPVTYTGRLICEGSRKTLNNCFQCLSFKASDFKSDMIELDFKSPLRTSWTYSKAAYCRMRVGMSLVEDNSPSICCLNFRGCTVAHDISRSSPIWLQTPESAVQTALRSFNSSKTGSKRV